MSRRIIVPPQSQAKDSNGIYLPPEPTPPRAQVEVSPDLSIDKMLFRILTTIDRILQSLTYQATHGTFDRETIQNLKDCTSILLEFKKKEAEILDDMSEEQLEAMVQND